MKSLIVYSSRHGNTEKIAYAIAAGLRRAGTADVFEAEDAPDQLPDNIDLVVVGGPTEAHRPAPGIASYVSRLAGTYAVSAASFDTRLRMARWLSGSAAVGIAKKLRAAGADLIVEPMSFFVAGKVPQLEPGELERAEAWGAALSKAKEGAQQVAAAAR